MFTMFQSNYKQGAAAVEFAVVLPLLVLLLFGMIECGLLFYNKQVVVNASREAVRAGITGAENIMVQQIAAAYCAQRLIDASGIVDPDLLHITITAPDAQNDLTVAIDFSYDFLFGQLIGIDQISIGGQTTMRMEPL